MAKTKHDIGGYYIEETPNTEFINTYTPILNLILSGEFDKGYPIGIIQFAGESGTFKSVLSLLCASAYVHQKPDSKLFFFDGEGGAPQDYFKSMGLIEDEQTIMFNFGTVEDLKQKVANVIENDKRLVPHNSVIVIDGIGMAASEKEVSDALERNNKSDFTRAKELNSLFRILTPLAKEKGIPIIVVNHTYDTMERFSKVKLKGGEGSRNSSNVIIHITKSKERDDKTLAGYSFNMTPYKSRYVKEGMRLPLIARYDNGIQKYSGLFDLALKTTGNIVNETTQSYNLTDTDTGEIIEFNGSTKFKRSDVEYCPDFWKVVISQTNFKERTRELFKLGAAPLIKSDYFKGDVF